MLRGWVEFRSLMAWGKKLLLSLSVFAIRQRKRLLDGSKVKRQLPGWFESLMMTNTAGQGLIHDHLKRGQETNQIWTHEAGTHDTHDRGLTLLPPPERLVPSLNSSTGEGGWALWRPLGTDTDRTTEQGPPERNRWRRPWRSWELWRPWRCKELWRPWRCRELRRPWQVVLVAVASVPSARPLQPEPFLSPQKISLGKLGGIRSPPGLNTDTGRDSPPGLDTQDKTVPQEQEALLG